MSKYTWIFVIFFILIFTTYLVDLTTLTASAETGVDIVSPLSADKVTVGSLLVTYFQIMGFRVEGLPAIINLLVFYPLTAILAYLSAEILKDLVPFT